jgi:hypothetical protein
VEIGADLGGHIGLFAVAYLLVSVLATRDQTGLVARFTTVGAHLSPQWLVCGPSRAGLEVAGVVVLVRTGPRPEPLRAVRSLTPWKWRTRLSSSARGLVTLSIGITARRSRPKVWTDPRLVSVVLAPQAPIAKMVRNRDLVTNADLAAVAYERSNRGDEIL